MPRSCVGFHVLVSPRCSHAVLAKTAARQDRFGAELMPTGLDELRCFASFRELRRCVCFLSAETRVSTLLETRSGEQLGPRDSRCAARTGTAVAGLYWPVEILMKRLNSVLCVGALGVLFGSGRVSAQPAVWQPSPGHTQVPIWPGAVPRMYNLPRVQRIWGRRRTRWSQGGRGCTWRT
jgi:hypothetical protein